MYWWNMAWLDTLFKKSNIDVYSPLFRILYLMHFNKALRCSNTIFLSVHRPYAWLVYRLFFFGMTREARDWHVLSCVKRLHLTGNVWQRDEYRRWEMVDQGDPGMGKSVLCGKIANEYQYQKMRDVDPRRSGNWKISAM